MNNIIRLYFGAWNREYICQFILGAVLDHLRVHPDFAVNAKGKSYRWSDGERSGVTSG
jgi:hypothetical protein